jgi:ubiquinone/menaquinone biosynthesis C-methylase UbiE
MSAWDESEVAAVWRQHAEMRNRMLAPATDLMMERAGVTAGARVLDLGTGTGDTALFAAERVGARGSVLATDSSPAMVEAAREVVRTVGAGNVTVERAGAEEIDARDFDAAIARMVLMFTDVPRALAAIRRTLKAGGHFAAAVWSSLEANPFHRIVIEAARAERPLPDPPPEIVRAFSLHDRDALASAFAAAGFSDVAVEPVRSSRLQASVDDAVKSVRESPVHAPLFTRLDETQRARAFARVADGFAAFVRDGRVVFPAELLVASGRA